MVNTDNEIIKSLWMKKKKKLLKDSINEYNFIVQDKNKYNFVNGTYWDNKPYSYMYSIKNNINYIQHKINFFIDKYSNITVNVLNYVNTVIENYNIYLKKTIEVKNIIVFKTINEKEIIGIFKVLFKQSKLHCVDINSEEIQKNTYFRGEKKEYMNVKKMI